MADLTIHEAIREKRDEIIRIAEKHGARRVTWSPESSLLDQAALMLELEGLLGRKVDIASDGWVKPSIREYQFCCRQQKSYFVGIPVMWRRDRALRQTLVPLGLSAT